MDFFWAILLLLTVTLSGIFWEEIERWLFHKKRKDE
jgi:hypothetical protein